MSDKMAKAKSQNNSKKQKGGMEKFENMWSKLFYACLGLTVIGIYYMARGVQSFRKRVISLNPDYEFSKYSDFLISLPILIVYAIFRFYIQSFLTGICEKLMKKAYRFPTNQKDRELGEKYRKKLPTHMFKTTMYFILTVFGYFILKDLNYYPKSLLGKGWLPNMFIKGYPNSFYLEKPPLFDFYYMVCLAYFSCDLIWLFVEERQTDFMNMLLHHICTISLIIFSHLVHYSNVGSIVLILHLESDIFVHSTRFLLQTDVSEKIKNINGILMAFNFIYTRVYVLGDIIYVLYHYVTWKGIVDWFLLIFLSIIYLLQFYWSMLLVIKMIQLFLGSKLSDTRDFKEVEKNKNKLSSKTK